MPIEYDCDGLKALNQLGVPETVTAWLSAQNIVVTIMPKSIKFVRKGNVVASAKISWELTKQIVGGTAVDQGDTNTTQILAEQIFKIGDAHLKQGGAAIPDPVIEWIESKMVGGTTMPSPKIGDPPEDLAAEEEMESIAHTTLPPKIEALKADPSEASKLPWAGADDAQKSAKKEIEKDVGVYPLASMDHAGCIPLVNATLLYQPVKGSSANSRYFCIGRTQQVNVGARYKGTHLSLRAEGNLTTIIRSRLSLLGFEEKPGDYMSVHVLVDNDLIAGKVIGAVLVGLGMRLLTPIPIVTDIKNKGS